MTQNLWNMAFEMGKRKWCVHGLAEWCRFSPCTFVQEVDCCGSCQYVRTCKTPCEAFRGKVGANGNQGH